MPKKMRPKENLARQREEKADILRRKNGVAKALAYKPPVLRENLAGCYIEFYAYDPSTGKMRRKRIKINFIEGKRKRREYAMDCIKRLNDLLKHSWNPWIDGDPDDLVFFEEGLEKWDEHVRKQHSNGLYRRQTFDDYVSKLKIMRIFVQKKYPDIVYMHQFNKRFVVDFLDYIYIERNNSAQTHNNYLNWLRTISQWFLERGMIPRNPTEGIRPIDRRLFTKERTVIPASRMKEIGEWTKAHDPHFALACQILYYCFIRPVEMTRLRIRDFNLKEGTVTIPASASKNKRRQTVTVPRKVIRYGVELGVFSAPMDDFVFSTGLRPGIVQIDPKQFRDRWAKVSRKLKLKSEWKFYSLKDTGITDMLRKKTAAPVDVKDQARHSSFKITEIYLDSMRSAVPEILEMDGPL